MTGFPVTTSSSTQVVLASTSGQRAISGVPTAPGWHVVDEFPLVRSANAGLDVLGLVSATGLVLTVRLFDLTARVVVEGMQAAISATSDTRAQSGRRDLVGGHVYQVQAQCVGASGEDKFAIIQQATLSN